MITSDSDNLIFVIQKAKIIIIKKSKRPKNIWMKPWLQNRNDKSAYNNIFSELLLTDKEEFRRYLRMNPTSYEVSNITKCPAAYIIFMVLVCFKQFLCGFLTIFYYFLGITGECTSIYHKENNTSS